MGLELRPTRKPIEAGDLELRVGERVAVPAFKQVLGLILQMAQIGTFGKRARRPCGSVDMATSFHRSARCPHIGLKEGSRDMS